MSAVQGLVGNAELRKRILLTIALILVYRIGVHVPTPGVDGAVMTAFMNSKGGLFNLFNTFTGGALERFSVFALGIMPYISASIIFQLLTAVVPYLEALKKEGAQGQKKINQYTRYATVALSVIQGFGISSWLKSENFNGVPLVQSVFVGPIPFEVMTIITLTAGTCFIMWLGEQISEKGIGDGASLIIFAGIAAGVPSGFTMSISLITSNQMSVITGLGLLLFMILTIAAIVYLETGQRRIPIQHSQRGVGRMSGQSSHLPLKLNLSGVIPPIFASSLLLFPATITQFVRVPWLQSIQESLNPSGTLYNIVFIALIVFFCFFYTEIVFNPTEVSDNLKKYGGFVPGVRAGKSTADYIQKVLDRLSVAGAAYLSAVCILPTLLIQSIGVPFYFGGTSLLILVGVAINTSAKLQAYTYTQKYDGFVRGAKVRSRRVQF
ncbi:MAG: preprotein translocase subunit SecY [Bdellovibrionales bacterium CG10_big_fil_rev_8_21_14_0_10_45_34]|nr:MAG: preprotein translocase subunit SecY [Bdellovibrionales bacterium CG10_big_fil_rev_8_21_14_0_10_45_34]